MGWSFSIPGTGKQVGSDGVTDDPNQAPGNNGGADGNDLLTKTKNLNPYVGMNEDLANWATGKPTSPGTKNTGTPLEQTWQFVTSPYQTLKGQGAQQGPGSPVGPSSPQPNLQDATTTQINDQLASEQKAYASRTDTTGQAGLLDQPTTSSRVLLGS